MTVRVGVDGGQTGLRLQLVGSGRRADAAGFRWGSDPFGGVVDAIGEAWRQAAGPNPPPVERICCGLTGWPHEEDARARIAAGIADAVGAREVWAAADMVTAHAGALPDSHGVVLAVGTGVIALGVDPTSGKIARADGWGHLFGDAGSAFAIGRAGLAAVLRAYDGRGPQTELTQRARERFGPCDQLTHQLYTSATRITDVADFAPTVLELATDDDVAGEIAAAAAAELATTATAAARVFPPGVAVPVACTGRLVRPGGFLDVELTHQLAHQAPHLRRVSAVGDALDGAAHLAGRDDPGPYTPFVYRYRRP